MSSHYQILLVLVYIVILLFGSKVHSQEAQKASAALGSEETFICPIAEGNLVRWTDVTNSIIIYTLNQEGEAVKNQQASGEKYNRYSAQLASSTEFNMMITSVGVPDAGVFLCDDLFSGAEIIRYNFSVEVPPDDIAVDCSSCTRANSSCNCQCSASGGSSPSTLRLEWKVNENALSSQPPTQDNSNSGQIEYSSSAAVLVPEDNSVVTCTIRGFENQDDIADRFPSRVEAKQTLRSPDCNVSVSDDNCPTVELSCSCVAYPSVPNSPEYFSYYSRQQKEDSSRDTLLNDTSQDVTPGSEIYFVCTADNGLNFTTKSAAVPNPCREGTTAIPTTTTEPTTTVTTPIVTTSNPTTDRNATTTEPSDTTDKNGPNGTDDGGGGNTAAIVGGVVGGCVGVAVIVIIIIVILKKRGNGVEGKSNTVTASTAATTNSAAPVYGVVNKSTKKKSDNTDGNGVNAKLAASPPEPTESAEYASVNKPTSQPQAAPRSSAPPEKMELQYADLDHGNRGPSNEVRQPTNEPTEYATVQSVIV